MAQKSLAVKVDQALADLLTKEAQEGGFTSLNAYLKMIIEARHGQKTAPVSQPKPVRVGDSLADLLVDIENQNIKIAHLEKERTRLTEVVTGFSLWRLSVRKAVQYVAVSLPKLPQVVEDYLKA
jgi:hypothetical protein